MGARSENPFKIGWAAVRANAVPMAVLWAMAAGFVCAYYRLPVCRDLMEPFAAWHRDWGWRAAFICQALFCGLLPGAFLLLFRGIRPRRAGLTILAQTLWCGTFGIGVGEMFGLLAAWLGDDTSVSTLVLKTAFDQFVWTVLVVAPANAVFYFWVGRDLSFARTRREWPRQFFLRVFLPNLVANWCVWIPVIFTVFAFPLPLQILVCGMACSCWSLLCLQLGRRVG